VLDLFQKFLEVVSFSAKRARFRIIRLLLNADFRIDLRINIEVRNVTYGK
jgi:hypothetical protein